MCGVRQMVYMSDQEGALKALTEAAVNELGLDGNLLSAVPEHSPVGESQSNGRAERAVQQVEDMVRTMKAAFEDRFGLRLSSTSPIMHWLVEHAACTITRSQLDANGVTAYRALHGKSYSGPIAEFGERLFWYVPKRMRNTWIDAGVMGCTWGHPT